MTVLTRIFLSRETPRRLRTGWRLAVHSGLFVALMALFAIPDALLAPRLLLGGGVLAEAAAITLATWAVRRWLDKRAFVSLGLRIGRRAWRDFLAGVAITAVAQTAIFLLLWTAGVAHPRWSFVALPFPALAREAVAALALWLLVGWSEELWMRGYWLQNIAEASNLAWGVGISSIVFAALHLANPHVSAQAEAGLVLAGLFLAYGYVRGKTLWLPIGLHFGWNLFEGTVYGFPVSGLPTFRLLVTTVVGPTWLTGGAFGPEAGAVVLPALALGAWLIARYTTKRGAPRGMAS